MLVLEPQVMLVHPVPPLCSAFPRVPRHNQYATRPSEHRELLNN